MTYLLLKLTEKVRDGIPRFEQFLQTHGLYIVGRSENEQEGMVELVVTAEILPEVRHLTNIAFDFFGESVFSLRIEYRTSHNKTPKNSKSNEVPHNSIEPPVSNDFAQ